MVVCPDLPESVVKFVSLIWSCPDLPTSCVQVSRHLNMRSGLTGNHGNRCVETLTHEVG